MLNSIKAEPVLSASGDLAVALEGYKRISIINGIMR